MTTTIISYKDFVAWHTAHGTDDIPEEILQRAYKIYCNLAAEHGIETADEKICGHEVWEKCSTK